MLADPRDEKHVDQQGAKGDAALHGGSQSIGAVRAPVSREPKRSRSCPRRPTGPRASFWARAPTGARSPSPSGRRSLGTCPFVRRKQPHYPIFLASGGNRMPDVPTLRGLLPVSTLKKIVSEQAEQDERLMRTPGGCPARSTVGTPNEGRQNHVWVLWASRKLYHLLIH